MAVLAAISPRCMQSHDHLIPPSVLAQYLRKARQVAFGQPLELTHHLLSSVHGVEAMDPKHDFDLDLEGQHNPKRFVFGIHQPATIHFDTTTSRRLASPL